jgi:HD-GYP domain-containing protein (c-di-GMP phosphodiesterase class II)
VRASHERWDGAGYPDGLAGTQIPLGARIVAVCDAYEAMTSDRCYRDALSHGAACEELRHEAGRQFDPFVVEAFLAEIGSRPAGIAMAEAAPVVSSERRVALDRVSAHLHAVLGA